MTIINYNAGNPKSIKNMLNKLGVKCCISSDTKVIAEAKKLILSGVGSFDFGMRELNNLQIASIIKDKVLVQHTPILGICLGAQLLGKGSEEGNLPGLGLIDMDVKKFDQERMPVTYKIPHMGWNDTKLIKESKLFSGLENEARFYFVHSYHFITNNSSDSLTTTAYGYEFISSFERGNIYGVQFHPEKSHKFGMQLLKNFSELV